MQLQRAVFLDRDGTLNYDCGYTYRPEQFRLLDGAVEGLRLLHQLNFLLVVATNQSGIGRGYFREEDMHAFNALLEQSLRSQGVPLRAIYYSPYHPTAGVGEYRRVSTCRKPAPGMLYQAAREHNINLSCSYVIGDKRSDILAGYAAGCRTILVRTGCAGGDECDDMVKPEWVADDLHAAAQIVAVNEGNSSPQGSYCPALSVKSDI